MNVEIGAEAAQFPEKEYINRIAFAVRFHTSVSSGRMQSVPEQERRCSLQDNVYF
jgi:hypothetical protein